MGLTINTKINVLIIISLVLVGGTSFFLSRSTLETQGKLAIKEYKTGVMDAKEEMLKELVKIAYTVVQNHLEDGKKEGVSDVDIKEKTLDALATLRYGNDNSGYFFIYDSTGRCILFPTKPQAQGTNMIETKDPNGVFVIKELIRAAKSTPGGGMFQYFWPKPGGDTPVGKLSFASHFGQWDWNIGTGIYTDDVDVILDQKAREMKDKVTSQGIKILMVISCIVLLALLACYFIISRGVVAPIRKMIDMLKDIARGKGDLTRRITDNSGDETQELAEWFNRFIENIQTMIKEIKIDSEKLTDASDLQKQISDQMSQASQDTAVQASTVASASQEMDANMNSVAAAMEEAANNVNMIATASEEMTATISEIAANTENARHITVNAVDLTTRASHRINELGNAAGQIGKVIETITDISDQVNLLSLNATIEAARAGDAGKGFAVVANEIKELAKQTSNATEEIKSRVQVIQTSTQDTVTQISDITAVVTDINEMVATIAAAVEEQSVTTGEIAENVSQASHGIGKVNENISQASTASKEVAEQSSNVNRSSEKMAESSSQVKLNASDLSELAGHLSAMVKKFKV